MVTRWQIKLADNTRHQKDTDTFLIFAEELIQHMDWSVTFKTKGHLVDFFKASEWEYVVELNRRNNEVFRFANDKLAQKRMAIASDNSPLAKFAKSRTKRSGWPKKTTF